MQQSYDDGKYTVVFNDKTGEIKALRHGEPWKDLSGDKLTYCMLAAHVDAQAEIARLRGALEKAIAEMEADLVYIEAGEPGTCDRSHIDAALAVLNK